ncbi:hypothetical protein D3C72_2310300 [compost metagenome]
MAARVIRIMWASTTSTSVAVGSAMAFSRSASAMPSCTVEGKVAMLNLMAKNRISR